MTLGRGCALGAQACPEIAAPTTCARWRPTSANRSWHTARRLLDLGLGYLALDRAGATLSTGERQRVQLARAVRNRTTGVLYVLDEPSIGLHPVERGRPARRDARPGGATATRWWCVDHDVRVLEAMPTI